MPHAQRQELVSKEGKRTRATLTENQAIEIYQMKLNYDLPNMSEGARASAVANRFGVSEKAVRDIWSRRTWARKTANLEAAIELAPSSNASPRLVSWERHLYSVTELRSQFFHFAGFPCTCICNSEGLYNQG